jgi:hypothetical protein
MRLSTVDWAYVNARAAEFIGRRWVFAHLEEFLRGPEGVLLLLGEPGVGKTAVAAQLARGAAGRLIPTSNTSDGDGAVPAIRIDAAYFCRAGKVDLVDVAQRLSDQLAEVLPSFAQARRASLSREIHIDDVQVTTGPVAPGAMVAGVTIGLVVQP